MPEIYEGIVEIKAIAREAGGRSKIAVASREKNVDAVGACVGPKGSRVQSIVDELKGEKIDIVPWHADQAQFVAGALSPAKVTRVEIDDATKTALVIVPDNQLSLAIGREGQNARLAAKLTGWRIDIKSETQIKEIEAKKLFVDLPEEQEAAVSSEEGTATSAEAGPAEAAGATSEETPETLSEVVPEVVAEVSGGDGETTEPARAEEAAAEDRGISEPVTAAAEPSGSRKAGRAGSGEKKIPQASDG